MSSMEKRLAKLETITSWTGNNDCFKVFLVTKLSIQEWTDFVLQKEVYELKPLPNQKDSARAVRMKFGIIV